MTVTAIAQRAESRSARVLLRRPVRQSARLSKQKLCGKERGDGRIRLYGTDRILSPVCGAYIREKNGGRESVEDRAGHFLRTDRLGEADGKRQSAEERSGNFRTCGG